MAEYFIRGGRRICGEFIPHGAKNAALPILAASILTGGQSVFCNCPDISDTKVMKDILVELGCTVREDDQSVTVDSNGITCCEVPDELMCKMRSSVFLAGALLARCGRAVISQPGGCSIGRRPIDIHIRALKKMGVVVTELPDRVVLEAKKMRGTDLMLNFPSVGATENIMMAALAAEGVTVIHNAAKEPEIADLQNYLVKCGAEIYGAGTSKIVVKGRQPLHGCTYKIMPDRIEAGTFLMAAACTGGSIRVKGIEPWILKSCCKLLRFAGCDISKSSDSISLKGPEKLYPVGKVMTGPYPGFPTDLQPQLTAIMATAAGISKVEETVFEKRYGFTKELIKMGADIEICRRIAIIKGNGFLCGNRVRAADLRGGAALVLAGLAAAGDTAVENIEFIERGYCCFHGELRELGADIDRCI